MYPIRIIGFCLVGVVCQPLVAHAAATPASAIRTLPGFEVQLLHSVPRDEQGSWVVLATDPQGRLYTSDERDRGLYRITLDHATDPPQVTVERVPVELPGAQGMTWAFGHLYLNLTGRGLFRIRDTTGDDMPDTIEPLGGTRGHGEHGNHAVKPTADGKALYINAGNFTRLPQELATPVKPNWAEDLLLPRLWDAKGHAKNVLAPGGWIARINPEATEWHVISTGYRNAYDFTLNAHGELFTWDSDMEWDMGMPWYRPTRLTHAVSGSDFGWRSGSGKWPDYFEDSLPPIIDVGPGSPTGMISGAGAKFPAKYQHALFPLDWTFGTIYATHLTPAGASYRAELEEFLSGSPLAVTSAVIGADGAMYFITGGRNTQSGLYRVVYRGDEPTEPANDAPDTAEGRAARELRQSLEAYHHVENPAAIDTAWPHLDSGDRFIRHAARIAIESQPVEAWATRALTEERPQARATALIALARSGDAAHRAPAINALLAIPPSTPEVRLAQLRGLALTFMRLGEPTAEESERVANHFLPQVPSGDDRIDTELIRLLVYLKDGRVIEPGLALMLDGREQAAPGWGELIQRNRGYGGTIARMLENHPPTRAIDIAFMLGNLRYGWTLEQRRAYFGFIVHAASYPGGASYTGFLKMIREAALGNTSDAERAALADITGETLEATPDIKITAPKGPGRAWTLEEAVAAVGDELRQRDFDAGRNLYFATSCAACHRFDGHGGNIGPDLSTVRNKFSTADLLEAIIDPSAAISDQYGTFSVKLKSGASHIGVVAEQDDGYLIHAGTIGAEPVAVAKEDVESITQLPISQMPAGLINGLNAEELRDLVAYMMSGGNAEHPIFAREP